MTVMDAIAVMAENKRSRGFFFVRIGKIILK